MNLKQAAYHLLWSFVFCLSFLAASSGNSFAQQSNQIVGKVMDQRGPLEFADIILYKKTDTTRRLASVLSDSTGKFIFKKIPAGLYLASVELVGYKPHKLDISVKENNENLDLGIIELQSIGGTLNTITISAQRKPIQKTPQGFIVKAEDNITQAAGTATDLLANTPTVLVDAEGGITIRGKSPMILINGRNSVLGSRSLDRIPASSIEKIEIINNPSAQYDADAEGGIINITLKKNRSQGTNGAFSVGGGYGAYGRLSSSFQLNNQAAKWNLGMAYDNRFATRERKIESNRTNFDNPESYFLDQQRKDKRTEQTHNLRMNIDFNPNPKNAWGLEAIYGFDGQHNYESLQSTIRNQQSAFMSSNLRFSDENSTENVFELALNYNRKFNNERKLFSAGISNAYGNEKENTDINTQSLTESVKPIGDPYLQRTSNYEKTNITNARFDYTLPAGPRAKLETGYKGIFRWLDADFRSLYNDNNEYIPDTSASNIFQFNEQVHAGYILYKSFIGEQSSPKWKYDAGIRLEQVFNQGKSGGGKTDFNNSYFNFFPSANLAFYLDKNDFLKWTYSRRINRPGLGQLNPFVDITDSLNTHGGNPYLEPELVNAVEMGYNKDWKHVNLTANVFFRSGTNTILPYTVVDSAGVAFTQPRNFGHSTTVGFEGIFSAQADKIWNATISISAFNQEITGQQDEKNISNSAFSWYVKTINNFNFWKGNKWQIAANYQAPTVTPQGKRLAVYNVDMGMQQKILKGNGRIGLTITDLFNTQRNGLIVEADNFRSKRVFKIDTRAVLLTFAYTFGTSFKEKLMENKFLND
jgi:outer membrane receptor protein involved in Fe transport